jgi:DNA-binding transcriptional ArsR family regulator
MMVRSQIDLLRDLRAVAEPTRLRLLSVLATGDFSVTDLTRILEQSQPRVSRHLKLLSEAGLLERYREQHWIYYRVPPDGPGAEFVRVLLAMIDEEDPQLGMDRDRGASILSERSVGRAEQPAGPEGLDGIDGSELAAVLVGEIGAQGLDGLLYVGTSPTGPLTVLGPRARRAVGLSDSPAEVRKARAFLHGRGLAHCALHLGGLQALRPGTAEFDVVVLDRVLAGRPAPQLTLNEAARLLKRTGRLLLIERYDGLADEFGCGAHALEVMREWIAAGGLLCTRLKPMDIKDNHLLLAVASACDAGAAVVAA